MKQRVLKRIVVGFLQLLLVLTIKLPAALAHDPAVQHNLSDSRAFPTLLPERARQLLSSMAPLGMAQGGSHDVNVKASVLCFCLHKAGETIEELQHLQAEWFDKGRTSFTAQNYAAAVAAYTRVINLNVRDARVYTNRGLSYANRGDYPQALEDFARAIDLNHHQAEAHYARALVAFIVDDISTARLDLQTAANLNYPPAEQLMRLPHAQSVP